MCSNKFSIQQIYKGRVTLVLIKSKII